MFAIGKSLSLRIILCAVVTSATPGTAAAALTLTRVASPSFGTVLSGASNRRLVLNTNGSISGSGANDYISGAAAGAFTVLDTSSPATIFMKVDLPAPLGPRRPNMPLGSSRLTPASAATGPG